MNVPEAKVQQLVRDVAEIRCVELFASYGVDLTRLPASVAPSAALLFCGVIGFTGSGIRGSLAIAGSQDLLRDSNPVLAHATRDWAGELANQLMGHIKSHLLGYGVAVYLSTPTVLRGEHLLLKTQSERPPLLFSQGGGMNLVGVWIDLETSSELNMTDREDPARAGLEGGSAVMF
jgi:hypothetical protein